MIKEITDKLLSRGATSLSERELLTLLLEHTADEKQVEHFVDAIYAECESLGTLRKTSLQRLRMVGGMGLNRARLILSAIELGRRVTLLDADKARVIMRDEDVVNMMRPMLQELKHEECWAIYLSVANGVLDKMCISRGSVQHTVVDVRQVVKRALELLASKIILVHNHPSGMAKPSSQDVALTTKIQQAAQLFDVELIDHVIVSSEGSYSFRSAGLLK